MSAYSLVDLLQQVPWLWDILDGQCLKGLLATSQELRNQAMEHAHCIRTCKHPDMSHLTCSKWHRLHVLDMSNSTYLPAVITAQLSKGAWPELQRLYLGHVNSDTFDPFSGKWPSLEASSAGCTTNAVAALVAIEWPLLRTLAVALQRNDNDAMPQLMKGQWPQLRNLSINGLCGDNLNHLRNCPWRSLERLQLSDCRIPRHGRDCLVKAYLPNLQELSLVGVGPPIQTPFSCCALLADSNWPLLSKLELIRIPTTRSLVAAGNWSHLQSLVLHHVRFFAEDSPILMKAHWPALRSLTLIGCFETSTVLDSCMQKWSALESLTVRVSTDRVSAVILGKASSQWPSLHVRCTRDLNSP